MRLFAVIAVAPVATVAVVAAVVAVVVIVDLGLTGTFKVASAVSNSRIGFAGLTELDYGSELLSGFGCGRWSMFNSLPLAAADLRRNLTMSECFCTC